MLQHEMERLGVYRLVMYVHIFVCLSACHLVISGFRLYSERHYTFICCWELGVRVWTGFVWLKKEPSGGFLWSCWWNLGIPHLGRGGNFTTSQYQQLAQLRKLRADEILNLCATFRFWIFCHLVCYLKQ